MKMSLYQRLALTTSIVFILVVSVIFWWMQNLEINSRFKAEQQLHKELAAHLVSDNPLLQEGAVDDSALKNLFHTMMVLGPSFEFYILDSSGVVITYSAEPGKVVRKKINLDPVHQMIDSEADFPLLGDDPRNHDSRKIFSVAPLIKNKQLQGYLYVIIGGEVYDSVFQRILVNKNLQVTLIVAIASVFFLMASLLLTFKIFVTPLRNLTRDVYQLRKEGFDHQLASLENWHSSHGEVHELATAFNEMIAQINLQMSQLQHLDAQRRELLSHISHDLRTPLASLQGYIETIVLKSDSLKPEQNKVFLERALKNAQLLKQLVDQIFELAHIESGQVAINLETFSLTEMLYDLCEKFAIEANKKNIQLKINCPEDSIQIKTDIGKLERVLSNLIENALRHTQKNGIISLGVNSVQSGSGWIVSVEDNGEGIAEDDVPRIFEANFRAQNAIKNKTGKNNTQHMGLGLAISRKLLHILGSEITVSSKIGKGTRFSFVLN
ncbi:MAG: HAMP domain-containing histidine kinase [Gammaproteobacteria bacterium]|nr:HAMP domain-containing histidine kinase [Gammaproteobacteria bacterium]